MAHPLDVVLRQYVAPVLKEAGFSKAGPTYRLAARAVIARLFDAYPTENVTAQAMGIPGPVRDRAAGEWWPGTAALRRPFRALTRVGECVLNVQLVAPESGSYPLALRRAVQAIRGDWMPPTKARPAARRCTLLSRCAAGDRIAAEP